MPASEDNLSVEETEALTRAKLGDLRKKINSESWSVNMETLLADWGEKAAGLRFMHSHSGGSWRTFGNHLAVTSIIVTSIASSMSLILILCPISISAFKSSIDSTNFLQD